MRRTGWGMTPPHVPQPFATSPIFVRHLTGPEGSNNSLIVRTRQRTMAVLEKLPLTRGAHAYRLPALQESD
jgi:hypothetical protein